MILHYLIDESAGTTLLNALRRRDPELLLRRVGDPGAPSLGTLDPALLIWCELHDFVLVTNNRHSMPIHLADHLANGRHIPGILLTNPGMSISDIVEILVVAAYTSHDDEHRDQIKHLLSL